jgi:hypothetical protein
MATNPPKRQAPKPKRSVIRWLLDSDPSIRWQVMRDLIGAPADEVADERARVATEGAGSRLLALQEADGRWGGAAWSHGWDSTMHILLLLREMGLDPASDKARRAVGLVRDRVTWQGCGPQEADNNPFFAGEVEPCINGQVAVSGAYFGQDVRGIVDRLLGEQLRDGGWNCEAPNHSTRSSFNTTICVLEALLEYELAFGSSMAVTGVRLRGQEYLLERRLLRRRSTGEVIERRGVDQIRLPNLVALRCAARARVPAPRRRLARRAPGRGDRLGRVEARRRGPVAPGDPVPRQDAGRDGRGPGSAEPVEYPARLTGLGLVCSTRLTMMLKFLTFRLLVGGFVVVYAPYSILASRSEPVPLHLRILAFPGVFGMTVGILVYLWCVGDFAFGGKGDAPAILIARGTYKFVRNPMYLSLVLILLGESLLFQS